MDGRRRLGNEGWAGKLTDDNILTTTTWQRQEVYDGRGEKHDEDHGGVRTDGKPISITRLKPNSKTL